MLWRCPAFVRIQVRTLTLYSVCSHPFYIIVMLCFGDSFSSFDLFGLSVSDMLVPKNMMLILASNYVFILLSFNLAYAEYIYVGMYLCSM